MELKGSKTEKNLMEAFAGEIVLATDKADLLPEVGKLVNEALCAFTIYSTESAIISRLGSE